MLIKQTLMSKISHEKSTITLIRWACQYHETVHMQSIIIIQ